jgi:hypothetical protein
MGRTATIAVAAREITSAAAVTAATPEGEGNLGWQQDDHNTYESNDDFFHDISGFL